MTRVTRRGFGKRTLGAAMAMSGLGTIAAAASATRAHAAESAGRSDGIGGAVKRIGPEGTLSLPRVRWGEYDISRVLVGHNPIKGGSHFSAQLSGEMREFFDDDHRHALELLRRCNDCGINTCQLGSTSMEELLRRHYAQGGKTQWIATFYSPPGAKAKDELRRILQMRPRPIGAQHFGATTDALMRRGKIDDALDTLKMLRDAGLLVGLCTHNHEVIDYAAERDWDVDFYQASLYRVKYDVRKPDRPVPNRPEDEYFEEDDRKAMLRTIAAVDKPCMVFKVLGANRHCRTDEDVQQAIRYTLDRIKPSDVILLGMWHKYKDQVGQDTDIVRQWKGPELH